MPREGFVLCSCCGQWVSKRTARRHNQGQAAPHVRATVAFERGLLFPSRSASDDLTPPALGGYRDVDSHPVPDLSPPPLLDINDVEYDSISDGINEIDEDPHDGELHNPPCQLEAVIGDLRDGLRSRARHTVTVEEADDDDMQAESEIDPFEDLPDYEDEELETNPSGLTSWDMLGEKFQREVADLGKWLRSVILVFLNM
ncbi:hypothetical protein HYDPIDRAFT_170074 [Hydnomerulius pinastri MD-312]|uniref:Uncharacterized protein n=1 Tax=Hydnomerulius pinastri MD-312 TaxID=994086 RepID=A0A0C9WB81_9AGAM|nr:hypothetical protein HYDPIDRAFT_170074 [Hydnomerulius pinastri MD-312]